MRRWVVAAALAGSIVAAAPALAAPPKNKAFKKSDGCTLARRPQVAKGFGSPVQQMRAGVPPNRDCYYIVGGDPAAGGTLTGSILYLKGDDPPDALEAVQRQVDPDQAGGVPVEPLDGVGKLAYLYPDRGEVVVASSKAIAFRLIWAPKGVEAPLTPQTRKALIRLAQTVVKRTV